MRNHPYIIGRRLDHFLLVALVMSFILISCSRSAHAMSGREPIISQSDRTIQQDGEKVKSELSEQATPSTSGAAQTSQEPHPMDEAARQLYSRFLDKYQLIRQNKETNRQAASQATKEAYDIAKEFLQKYRRDGDIYTNYLIKYTNAYESAVVKTELAPVINNGDYQEAFGRYRQILSREPENLKSLIFLSEIGVGAEIAGQSGFKAEAINYTKHAIRLINAGITLEPGKVFAAKDEIQARLNYNLAVLMAKDDPGMAVSHLTNALKYDSSLRSEASVYALLAQAYGNSEYEIRRNEYAERCTKPGATETSSCKSALKEINHLSDRIIDAYAHAVAFSSDPKYSKSRDRWMAGLIELYKYRHEGSDIGLPGLIERSKFTPFDGLATTELAVPVLSDLLEKLKPSVVRIYTGEGKGGIGFFIAPTQVISAWHVVEDSDSASVKTVNGKVYEVQGVLAVDKDIVLLQVNIPDNLISPLPVADKAPKEGDTIFVIGNPGNAEGNISNGIVSGFFNGRIATHAPIADGDSGSPMFNLKGEVVGVVWAIEKTDKINTNYSTLGIHIKGLQPGPLKTLAEINTKAP